MNPRIHTSSFLCQFLPLTLSFTHHPYYRAIDTFSLISSSSSLYQNNQIYQDDEEDIPNYLYYRPQAREQPDNLADGTMISYTESNIRQSAQTFQSIRSIGGKSCTNDIYVKAPSPHSQLLQYDDDNLLQQHQQQGHTHDNSTPHVFWYVGKLARTDGTIPNPNDAIQKVWNIIEEHACRLRPVELGRYFHQRGDQQITIWIADGDSEIEMSQNQFQQHAHGRLNDLSHLNLKQMSTNYNMNNIAKKVSMNEVGYMAEVVTNSGKGFYIVRNEEGKCI